MKHYHIKSNNKIFSIVDEINLAPGAQKCVVPLIIEIADSLILQMYKLYHNNKSRPGTVDPGAANPDGL